MADIIGATTAMVAALARPTPPERVQWRGDRTTRDKSRINVLGYIDARYVDDTLNEVVLPENWQNRYEDIPGGTRCGIGILIAGEWVWKWDAAPHSDIESVKGGHSDSMKRAAVHWGIGRDLYDLPDLWVPAKETYSGSGKYEPAILPTWNGSAWVTDNTAGGGRAGASSPARPPARPQVVREGPDDPFGEFAPIGGKSAPAEIPTDDCPIHGVPWNGEPGDLWHKGPEGYCRHPENVRKARRA